MTNEIRDNKNRYDEANGYECSFRLLMISFVESMLKEGDGLAEPHNGVGQLGWVAKDKVEHPTNEQGQYSSDPVIHFPVW